MRRESGFTLLELLIVMTIVGILGAIAIPQYQTYRQRSFDTRAREDLRSVALAEETYFMDTETYLSCKDEECIELPGLARLSSGVTLSVEAGSTSFLARASHRQGSGKVFRWDSDEGGLVD